MALSISVVIPYYNGSRFIEEALASVRGQTLAPEEIIVVDDGSRPEEAAALDRAAEGCVVIHLPSNRGVSVARNTGVARARAEWIAFLDCDDLWAPSKLERQAAVAAASPDCRAVHCGVKTVLPDGRERVTSKGDVTLEDFLVFPCPIFPSAVLMRHDALIESGLFDPTMRCCQDLDLFLRFCFAHGKFCAVADPLLIRRIQNDGVSRNIATFWSEADRIYRDFLPVFGDTRRSRAALLDVQTDMLLRAVYARDVKLLGRILRRAVWHRLPLGRALGQVAWTLLRNRARAAGQ